MKQDKKVTQEMEWLVLETISLSGLSLKKAHSLIEDKMKKHGEDVVLDISSETQTNYSSRVDSSYITSHSMCYIKKLIPALTAEEKNKKHEQHLKAVHDSVTKMFEGMNLVSREKV